MPIVEKFGTILADVLLGTDEADDWIAGNDGNDTIRGFDGQDKLNGNRGDDTVYGGFGNDKVLGGAGNDDLYGDEGNDRISGDQGNDRMTGGSGRDTFVFINRFNSDLITDFNPEDDTIQFARKSFTSFAAVQAAWHQDGDDVVITTPIGQVLRIENILLESLTAADFVFA